jgi:hypothetical protein
MTKDVNMLARLSDMGFVIHVEPTDAFYVFTNTLRYDVQLSNFSFAYLFLF